MLAIRSAAADILGKHVVPGSSQKSRHERIRASNDKKTVRNALLKQGQLINPISTFV